MLSSTWFKMQNVSGLCGRHHNNSDVNPGVGSQSKFTRCANSSMTTSTELPTVPEQRCVQNTGTGADYAALGPMLFWTRFKMYFVAQPWPPVRKFWREICRNLPMETEKKHLIPAFLRLSGTWVSSTCTSVSLFTFFCVLDNFSPEHSPPFHNLVGTRATFSNENALSFLRRAPRCLHRGTVIHTPSPSLANLGTKPWESNFKSILPHFP